MAHVIYIYTVILWSRGNVTSSIRQLILIQYSLFIWGIFDITYQTLVVVVFTLKIVLTSTQYPSLS